MKNSKLNAARTCRAWSQAELAKRAGVTRQTIIAIEKGECNPSIDLCRIICRILGKTLDEIFWIEE